jgi:endonuclease/exonuclease/phosphatase family metal-dependent hydrolase
MKSSIIIFLVILIANINASDNKSIQIGTFNIRFFPCNQDGEMMKKYNIEMRHPPKGSATDTTKLFQVIKELDIEVLGIQELVDPALFGAMAKRHLGNNFEFIYAPSNAWQKVGIMYNSEKIKLIGQPQIYSEVALGKMDRHRPALRAYFKALPDGFDFHVIVVHLKASPRGYPQRIKQWEFLDSIMNDLPTENESDVILLGDFNNVSKIRYDEFIPLLEKHQYFWPIAENDTIITQYWRPDWNVERIESGTIDHLFISSDAKIEYIENSTKVGGYCSDQKKEILGEFPFFYEQISDHCPVYSSFKSSEDND